MDLIWERIKSLSQLLRRKLAAIEGVHILDRGKLLCGIVSFTKVILYVRCMYLQFELLNFFIQFYCMCYLMQCMQFDSHTA